MKPLFLLRRGSRMQRDLAERRTSPTVKRYTSVDCLKVVAMLGVIALHTKKVVAFDETRCEFVPLLINQAARFAVPFFFGLSGFFLSCTMHKAERPAMVLWKYVWKILLIYFSWSVVYIVLPTDVEALMRHGLAKLTYWKLIAWYRHPVSCLFDSITPHLWFLPSLVMGVAIVGTLHLSGLRWAIVPVGVLFYSICLLGGAYRVVPVIGLSSHLNLAGGPFPSVLPIAVGWRLAAAKRLPSARTGLFLAAFGLAMQVTEAALLWLSFGTLPTRNPFLVGTQMFAGGLLLFALGKPDWCIHRFVAKLGRYTAGVYLSHYLFVDALNSVAVRLDSWTWHVVSPFIDYALALALTMAMSVCCRRRAYAV